MHSTDVSSGTFALTQFLLAQYGSTLGYEDLAAVLKTTPVALRLRRSRRRDLPRTIPGLASCRWAAPVVAEWLVGEPAPKQAASEQIKRGPGRPRKRAA